MDDKMKKVRKDKFVGDEDEGKAILEAMQRAAKKEAEDNPTPPPITPSPFRDKTGS